MMYYRIFVTDEDSVLFCYANNLELIHIDETRKEAREDYPDSDIFVEAYETNEQKSAWNKNTLT